MSVNTTNLLSNELLLSYIYVYLIVDKNQSLYPNTHNLWLPCFQILFRTRVSILSVNNTYSTITINNALFPNKLFTRGDTLHYTSTHSIFILAPYFQIITLLGEYHHNIFTVPFTFQSPYFQIIFHTRVNLKTFSR